MRGWTIFQEPANGESDAEMLEKWFGRMTEGRKIALLCGIALAGALLLLWAFPVTL